MLEVALRVGRPALAPPHCASQRAARPGSILITQPPPPDRSAAARKWPLPRRIESFRLEVWAGSGPNDPLGRGRPAGDGSRPGVGP